MFNDPFYFGWLIQDKGKAFLPDMGVGFVPMITEELFTTIQLLTHSTRKGKTKANQERLPLRDVIYCNIFHGKNAMIPNVPSRYKPNPYLYLSCKNKGCSRSKPTNVRAKVILEAIEPVIADVISRLTGDAYKAYLREAKELSSTQKKALRSEMVRLQATVERIKSDNNTLSLSLAKTTDENVIRETNGKLSDGLSEINKLEVRIDEAERKLKRQESQHKVLTPQEFSEIIEKTASVYKNGDVSRKERIIREMFSKLSYGKEKVESYTLQEPFRTLLAVSNDSTVSPGGEGGIRTLAPAFAGLPV